MKVEMETKIQKLQNLFRRFAMYATIRMVIMGTLNAFVIKYELTELVDVGKITIMPTITEMISIYKNQKSIAVILARSLLNVMYYSEDIASIESLFALYKLFSWPIEFGLSYFWYSLMKFGIKQVLMWAWNMNESEWPLLSNPSRIHAAVTFQQIDAIEFKSPHLYMAIGTCVGIVFEILNYDRIIGAIKQWCYNKITMQSV